jgi:predicted TIM-barrel fold metal-dependent hydrolase
MRIDAHAHVIVPELLREPWGPRVRWEDGAQIVELGGRPIRSAVRDFVAIDAILAAQDEAGIDRIVLCPWVNVLGYEVPVDEARERARIQNGGLAALRDAQPDRVSVLGTVPL